MRSLITLKALTYAPTGGIVAAPTTSLPEQIGGVRNWDYRYCWLRDATFTLLRLARRAAITDEAAAWRDWLLRAVAGDPRRPADHVRRGAASAGSPSTSSPGCRATRARRRCASATPREQFQLDVYGEVHGRDCTLRVGSGCDGRTPARVGARDMAARSEHLETVWQRARRRDLGSARAAAALHPLEGDGLGRVRPRGQVASSSSVSTARSSAGGACATRSTTRSARAAGSTRAQHLHAVLRLGGARRQPADDAARRVPARHDPRMRRHGRGDRAGADASTASSLATETQRGASTGCRPARARSCRARSGWPTTTRCMGRATRRGDLRAAARRSRTTSGCSPRSTTPATKRLLGNFPQAFSHLALINTAASLSLGDEGPLAPRTPSS